MTSRNPTTIHAKRIGPTLVPDRARVLMRPFRPTTEDISRRIVAQVLALSEVEVAHVLDGVMAEFGDRHHEVENFFLNRFTQVRRRNFDHYTAFFNERLDTFVPARQTPDVETAWLCYPVLVRPEAGFHRSDLQEYLDTVGIDSRTIWTGNVTRQPMMKGVEYRQPAGGLPNCDRVMESGTILSCSHGMTQEELEYTTAKVADFCRAAGR